ncbi:MAG: hypothetical protein K1X95_08295 [Acidimicrobiia bacterium]|nr:hypothetical protein [Acidimicrobiia bacterium]
MDDFDTTWLDGVAASAGVDALTPEVVEALLDAAGRAARETDDRRNAPLACFVAGLALGRRGEAVTADSVAAIVA